MVTLREDLRTFITISRWILVWKRHFRQKLYRKSKHAFYIQQRFSSPKSCLLFVFNFNWVDTRLQQYSTHLHTNSTQNTQNGTYIIKEKNWEVQAMSRLCELCLGICLKTEEKARKPPVREVEKCPDIPVAIVQYTVTHKQYTEQHNETEYTELNTHNNKNT
jgi:hypothetical protein